MFTFLKATILKFASLSIGYTDSIDIEQAAFNEFISRVDSIAILNYPSKGYFQKDSNHIYFSGKTELYSAMPFALNQMCRRTNFILIDSTKDYAKGVDRWIYPEKGSKEIKCSVLFLVKPPPSSIDVKQGDLQLFMSNRYYHNGFYYVKFLIVQDIYKINWYYKLDATGRIIDYVTTAGVN